MEKSFNPVPAAPYFFEKSKRFPGQSLEELVFTKSASFFSLADQPHHEGDSMHAHIEFMLSAGDVMETKMLCPYCRQDNVKFFLFLNHSLITEKLACCDNPRCKHEIKLGHGDDSLIAIKIRNLRRFKKKGNRQQAEKLFRHALGLRPSDSAEKIFEAISSGYLNRLETVKKIETVQKPVAPVAEKMPEPLPMRFRDYPSNRRKRTVETQPKLF